MLQEKCYFKEMQLLLDWNVITIKSTRKLSNFATISKVVSFFPSQLSYYNVFNSVWKSSYSRTWTVKLISQHSIHFWYTLLIAWKNGFFIRRLVKLISGRLAIPNLVYTFKTPLSTFDVRNWEFENEILFIAIELASQNFTLVLRRKLVMPIRLKTAI